MSGYIQANTDGRLHDAREASLSPLNRGFLYGDAIYEVWRTYGGVVFGWQEHWSRLETSASALSMALPFDRAGAFAEIQKTAAAFRSATGFMGELYIRLQVHRGEGPIGLAPALSDRTGFVFLVQPCPLLSREHLEAGMKLSIARRLRRNPAWSLNPAWKTGNYLNNLLCLHEARERNADEVVILNEQGEVTEAAVMNLAFVQGDTVVTPPPESGILRGITRGMLLSILGKERMREQPVTEAMLKSFDECFLLSTTKDIVPVACIDNISYRVGSGTVTRRVKAVFESFAEDRSLAHPELKV